MSVVTEELIKMFELLKSTNEQLDLLKGMYDLQKEQLAIHLERIKMLEETVQLLGRNL